MRFVALALALWLLPDAALAQVEDEASDAERSVALSADQRAQLSLGGFRAYLERVREDDDSLYRVLDARLDELEERTTIADVIFWTGTILSVGALVAAIPVHEEVGLDPALGLVFGGVGTFLLAVIVQAIVRPGQSDLMALIDLYDERLGRR